MNRIILSCILVVLLAALAHPEPAPEPLPQPAKSRVSSRYNEPANPKFRSAVADIELRQAAEVADEEEEAEDEEAEENANDTPVKGDASSGRLFMKKFLLFKNMFGNSNQQPVIPIIITGAGATGTGGTATAVPTTTTITSTGTIPTATGTITTSPASAQQRGSEYDGGEDGGEGGVIDEQALQAALAAGGQEYVVTDEEIKGTSQASRQTNRVNLRRKGAKKGQVISVRIPPKYRRYFKNGQRVMLNTSKRPPKRRVVKKRANKNRRRVNKRRNRLGA